MSMSAMQPVMHTAMNTAMQPIVQPSVGCWQGFCQMISKAAKYAANFFAALGAGIVLFVRIYARELIIGGVGLAAMQVMPPASQFLERFSKWLWNNFLPTTVKTKLQGQFPFTS